MMMATVSPNRPQKEYWYQFVHRVPHGAYIAIVRGENQRQAEGRLRRLIDSDGVYKPSYTRAIFKKQYRCEGRHQYDWQKYRCRPAFDVLSYQSNDPKLGVI